MKCPECNHKITKKNFDADYGWYECPECEGCFTDDELETEIKASLGQVKDRHSDARLSDIRSDAGSSGKVRPLAKGKKRLAEIAEDEEAIAKFEAETLKPKKSAAASEVHHRDEIPTGEILNVIADELELIAEELGIKLDRVNAREFYAMNIWRPLSIQNSVRGREKSTPHSLCQEHA